MAQIIGELTERRTAHEKHFLRDDGQIEVHIQRGQHYLDRDAGTWLDSDPAFLVDAMIPGFAYNSKRGRARTRIGLGRYRVGFGIGQYVTYQARGLAPGAILSVAGNVATIAGAWNQTDLKLTAFPEGVKADVVLNGPGAPSAFTFDLAETAGCTARGVGRGLEFIDSMGRVIGRVPAPTVQDAAGAMGTATLLYDAAAGTITLSVDSAWLADPGRSFPVVLDPTTFTSQPDEATSKDAWYYSGNGTMNDNLIIHVGWNTAGGYALIGLIQFDISSIPAGATISSSTLTLYCEYVSDSLNANVIWYPNTGTWSETSGGPPAYDGAAGTAGVIVNAVGFYSWNVTSIVTSWYNGTRSNYGFQSNTPSTQTGLTGRQFTSSAGSTAANRPKLTVVYNRAPNTPTTLSPGGAAGSPARVNTTTPTLAWVHSDPDGDAQASFQVVITRNSDSVVVHDSGEVVSGASNYTVPGGVLAVGQTYRWKVRTKDSGGLWSAYAAEVYVYVNQAPSATATSPLGTSGSPAIIANSTTPTLQWTFADADGDAQAKYRVIYRRASDNLLIRDTGWVASAAQSYAVPAGDLAYGVTYYWQVQVEDPYGAQSALTAAQYFQPNQTAGTPTNLAPAGTSGNPAEINTLTPTLTWTHNDPDLDPQKSFQVLIIRSSDLVQVHDSGEVVSASGSYTVPAAVLAGSAKYHWRVRTKDTGSNMFGPYSADAYIYTNQAPYAPTNLAPASNAVFDATQAQVFTWQFQDPDVASNGDAQTAYQLLIKRVSDGVQVYDSGKVVSASSQHSLPANTLVNGVSYQWQVRTWDATDLAGPYSALASFLTGRPPTVTVTSPANGGTYPKGILTAQWAYSDPDGDSQQSYRAVLKTGAGATIEDSGTVASAATSHQFATVLANNTAYQVTVTVTDASGQSATYTSAFTTSFVPPTTPILGLVASNALAKIALTITNPDNDPMKPLTSRNDLYRRKVGDAAWVRIAKSIAKNGSYDDYAVASGVLYEYKVVAISVDETTAEAL